MGLIQFSRPWDQQPQEVAGIDWGNPLNQGLIEAYNWGAGGKDLVRGLDPLTDYAVPDVGPAGRAVTFSAEKHTITGKEWAGATEWTFLVLALPGTVRTAALSFGNGAGASGQSYLLFNTSAAFGNSVGAVGFGSGANAVGSTITSVAGGIISRPAVYVGVQSDQRRAYRDGVLLGTGASGAITIGGGGHGTCLNGIQGYTGWGSTGHKYFLAMVWERGLSPDEVAQIGANPWQLFEPSRILVPVASAPGGDVVATITGAAATSAAGAITATGGATGAITGVQATSAAGTASAAAGATAAITGTAATAQAGAITATAGASASIVGASATSAAGTVSAAGGATAQITGAQATGAAGAITAEVSGSVSATITGAAATAAAGTITAVASATAQIVGAQATAAAGSITVEIGVVTTTATVVGASATAAAGTVAAVGGASAQILGAQAVAAAGNIIVMIDGEEATPPVNIARLLPERRIPRLQAENRIGAIR